MDGDEEDLEDELEADSLLHCVHGGRDLSHAQQIREGHGDKLCVHPSSSLGVLVPRDSE